MSKLKGTICYLAGPIDRANDDGILWRKTVKACLVEFGIRFIDPTQKKWDSKQSIASEKTRFQDLKSTGKFKECVTLAHKMRLEDLRCVDISDFLIVLVDPNVHMCGTYDEIFRAERQNKPMFAVVKGGKRNCPNWLFDVFRLEEMFDDLPMLIDHISEIAGNRIQTDDRWVLVREHI